MTKIIRPQIFIINEICRSRRLYNLSIVMPMMLCLFLLSAGRAEKINPEDLSAEEFLEYARRPFVDNAWGYFKGDVQHKSEDVIPVEMSILFKPDFIRCQVVLEEDKIYDINQVVFGGSAEPALTIDFPASDPEGDFLDMLGIHSTDITFSFLFWELREQKDDIRVRGRKCRVMELEHPQQSKKAIVAFSAKHFFPLKVDFYGEGEEFERSVEFTDFKKYKDFWYVKSLRITGDSWKTRLHFSEAELARVEDKEVPSELFIQADEE